MTGDQGRGNVDGKVVVRAALSSVGGRTRAAAAALDRRRWLEQRQRN